MPAYLSGWDNRAKIVIDHSLIDEALTDFPLAIPISASCGQGSQDLSAIFDELVYTFSGDDFTGNDDDPPDTDLWEVLQDTGSDLSIQSNKLNYDSAGDDANYFGQIRSKFKLSGDFDIQIDFDSHG